MLEAAGIPFQVTTVVSEANVAVLDRLVLTLAAFGCARGIGLDLLVVKGRARTTHGPSPADRHALAEGIHRMVTVLNAVNARRISPIRLRERDLLAKTKAKSRSPFCHACRG